LIQGSRRGRIFGEPLGGDLEMHRSDWSTWIRCEAGFAENRVQRARVLNKVAPTESARSMEPVRSRARV
jgi:hypothetical protein